MMQGKRVYRLIWLLFCFWWVISCETMQSVGGKVSPRTPADYAYHTAVSKNTTKSYWRFLERYSVSQHADKVKEKLAKLLIKDRNKDDLARYVQDFPGHKHLVADVLKEIQTVERINTHLMTDVPDGSRVTVRPGEVVYSRGYFKAYAGLLDYFEDTSEPTYEIRLEQVIAPEFMKVTLLTDQSFIMVEKFDALVNIYYRIEVSSTAPPGEYKAAAIVGAYQIISPDEESRKGGKEMGLTIEVVKHPLNSLELLEADFKAVEYFRQRQEKMQAALNNLTPPEGSAFGSQYMYKYNYANYTTRLAEYKAAQAEACRHLKQAAENAAPEIAAQVQAYINKLRGKDLFIE